MKKALTILILALARNLTLAFVLAFAAVVAYFAIKEAAACYRATHKAPSARAARSVSR